MKGQGRDGSSEKAGGGRHRVSSGHLVPCTDKRTTWPEQRFPLRVEIGKLGWASEEV